MAQNYKVIRKTAEVHATNGFILDSLDSNSSKDAPSVRAVNEGKTKVSLDNVAQKNVSLSTTRTVNPQVVKVQIKDTNGRVVSVESTLDNVFIKSKDGSTETSASSLLVTLYNIAKSGYYGVNMSANFTELDKYL